MTLDLGTLTRVRLAAMRIADSIIADARNSGADPIAWVTGNAYMPPLRSFNLAEDIYQADATGDAWELLSELVDAQLAAADVILECPEWDNALYAVDLARFGYREDTAGETLQDDWSPVTR